MPTDSEIDDLAKFMHDAFRLFNGGGFIWEDMPQSSKARYLHVARAILLRERPPRQHQAPKRQMEYCR